MNTYMDDIYMQSQQISVFLHTDLHSLEALSWQRIYNVVSFGKRRQQFATERTRNKMKTKKIKPKLIWILKNILKNMYK